MLLSVKFLSINLFYKFSFFYKPWRFLKVKFPSKQSVEYERFWRVKIGYYL